MLSIQNRGAGIQAGRHLGQAGNDRAAHKCYNLPAAQSYLQGDSISGLEKQNVADTQQKDYLCTQ